MTTSGAPTKSATGPASPLALLVVEDNPADVRLLQEAFGEAELDARLAHAPDAEVALEMLRGGERYDAVILDLNMPRVDGRSFLRTLRSDPAMADTHVIVLTSSHYDRDARTCQQLGVENYLIKPTDFDEIVAMARHIARVARR